MAQPIPNKPVPVEPELIQCEICLKEIPGTVAVTAEGPDYVQHFCGIECYGRWRTRAERFVSQVS